MKKNNTEQNKIVSYAKEWLWYIFEDRTTYDRRIQMTRKDFGNLRKKLNGTKNHNFKQRKGWIFECVEALKFNRRAVRRKDAEYEAHVTDAEGQPHSPYDIYITRNGETIKKVQAKVNKKPVDTAWQLSNSKYKDMQRITTKDNVYRVKEISKKRMEKGGIYSENYENTYEQISENGLGCDGIYSGGTSERELKRFAKHHNIIEDTYEFFDNLKANGTAEVWNFTWDLGEDIFDVLEGKKDKNDAIDDTVNNIVKRFAKVFGKSGVMVFLKRIGIKNVRVSDPTSDFIIKISPSVEKVIKGKIDSKEFAENIVDAGLPAVRKIMLEKVDIPLFPAYYMYYCSAMACIKTLQENRLSIKESQKLIFACQQLLEKTIKQKEELEKEIELELEEFKDDCRRLVEAFEITAYDGIDINKLNEIVEEINAFANMYGLELNYIDREKFDKDFFSKKKMVIK